MNPTWPLPVIASVLVTLWKVPMIRRGGNRRGHLFDLCYYVGAAFVLYGVLYLVRMVIPGFVGGVAYGLVIHVATIIVFVICCVLVLYVGERGTLKLSPADLETLVGGMDRMYKVTKRASEGYDEVSERVNEVESNASEKMSEIVGKIDDALEMQKARMNDFEETLIIIEKERRGDSAKTHERLEEWEEELEEVKVSQGDNMEALRREVEAFKGMMAEKSGHEWEDVITDRIESLNFDVEVGRVKGEPDVIIKNSEGDVVGVVGCKSYALRSRRGMSNMFKPEVEFAREVGVPLGIAIQNRLNNLEFFKVYEQGELEDFSCSAPPWLAGESVSKKDRDEQAKCRRDFKDFIVNIS